MNPDSYNAQIHATDGELVTPAQAAWYLNVAKNTVYHWIRMGYFPHYRVGKLIRIRLKDLRGFLDESRSVGPAPSASSRS